MELALREARRAGAAGDVPVGAVVADETGAVIAVGHNQREQTGDPTAHAELVALRAAAAVRGGWNLTGTTLAVTVEPCLMCAGAVVQARVSVVLFGCPEPKTGAVGSLWDVLADPRSIHRPLVHAGILADDAARLMREFFAARRLR